MPDSADAPQPEFSEFTLDGTRFNGGRLPIDALVELERYRALLLAAAEKAWRRANPLRELPEDFGSEFDLAIIDVRDGSAQTVLERPESEYGEYFDLGRDEVDRLFREIVAGVADEALTRATGGETQAGVDDTPLASAPGSGVEDRSAVPDGRSTFSRADLESYILLPAFRDLGASLQSHESVAIKNPGKQRVLIDQEVRAARIQPLIDRVEAESELGPEQLVAEPERRKDRGAVAGRLIALSPEEKNYSVATLHYGRVSGRYSEEELTEDLKSVLNSSAQAPVIRISGRLSWKDDSLSRILEAESVELLEVAGESWSRKIVELASLRPNWGDDGESGEMISFTALEAALVLLRATQGEQEAAPGIFPMEDGGVQIEWTTRNRVTSVEISADDEPELFVHSFQLEPRESTELTTHNLAEAQIALLEVL